MKFIILWTWAITKVKVFKFTKLSLQKFSQYFVLSIENCMKKITSFEQGILKNTCEKKIVCVLFIVLYPIILKTLRNILVKILMSNKYVYTYKHMNQ